MAYYIGIDLGGTEIKSVVIDENLNVRENSRLFSGKNITLDAFVTMVSQAVSLTQHKHNISKSEIEGIGIGLPGCINYREGMVYDLPNINGWKNIPLRSIIENAFNFESVIDNDVNMMAIGELYAGNALGAETALCITLGTGVGGGLIINSKIYRGPSMTAGEIGHITVEKNGPICNCGNRGCLEMFVGNNHLVSYALSRIEHGTDTLILELAEGCPEKVTPKLIAEAAEQGDKTAKEIFERAGEYLGIALAGVINLINPSIIVIGGGVSQAGDIILEPIIKTIDLRALPIALTQVSIKTAKLGNLAGAVGSAILACKKDNA